MEHDAGSWEAALDTKADKGHDHVNECPVVEALTFGCVLASRIIHRKGYYCPDGKTEERAVVKAAGDAVAYESLLIVLNSATAAFPERDPNLSDHNRHKQNL